LLFAELQRSFPSTSEARVSRVSLGKLLLGAGRAREAEQQFRAYLTQRGDLTEEALVGRAESLARLGQRADERGVWRELLTSRPSSVYATRARERLRELTPGENDPTRAP
jgi:TolA-binding protein